MKTPSKFWPLASFVALLLAGNAGLSQTSSNAVPDNSISRGRYLVERVALCADCHSQRDWKGKQDRDRWLRGAQLDFKPARMMMPWAAVAPDIAGLPSFETDEPAVKFFETGVRPDGKSSKPPMPQYRLERADAEAVVAYLRSLKPRPEKGGR